MIKGFLSYLKSMGYSQNTIENYTRDVMYYHDYLINQNITHLKRTNADTVMFYLKTLNKKLSSLARTLASIKAYYNFALKNNIIDNNPINTSIKYQKQINDTVITDSEYKLILNQIKGNKVIKSRDKAILNLMYLHGFSVSDIINLRVDDIPKLSYKIKTALSDYINKRASLNISDSDSVFINHMGTGLTRQGLWKMIKSYATTAGIKKNVTLHMFRVSHIKKALNKGANITDIAQKLGFKSTDSIKKYIKEN